MLEMDHCLSNPCDANAICTNTDDHSFTCKCKAGFSGNGIQCKGIFFSLHKRSKRSHSRNVLYFVLYKFMSTYFSILKL